MRAVKHLTGLEVLLLGFLIVASPHVIVCQETKKNPVSSIFDNNDNRVSVETPFGALIGVRHAPADGGCDAWLGVPYAEPPIQELRFADTVPWTKQYENDRQWDATQPSPFCAQKSGGSEDCLYLNVWRPTTTNNLDDDGLPVMLFIHGGSFTSGSGLNAAPGLLPDSLGEYNGCHLSQEQNVIVASMNYRLGPFGFTAFHDDDDDATAAANFGLQDQRVAIQWIKQHVASFGGDPNAITIFGESAGAMSVLAHIAAPKSQNLFRAAVSQSGYPIALSWKQGLDLTHQFAKQAGCAPDSNKDDDAASSSMRSCLRSKSTKHLISAAEDSLSPLNFLVQTGWNPVVDGSELPQHPLKALSVKGPSSIPLLIGTNTDEANLFLYRNYPTGMWPSRQFDNWLERFTNNHNAETKFNSTDIQQVKGLYNRDIIQDRRRAAATIATDGSFLCGSQATAQMYQRAADVFVYRFNHRPNCFTEKLLAPGIYHTLELVFVFRNSKRFFCQFDQMDNAVGLRVRTMWANFAKTLDPSLSNTNTNNNFAKIRNPSLRRQQRTSNSSSMTEFPKYTNQSRQDLVIQGDGGDEVESNYRATFCNFWQDKIFNKFLVGSMGPEAIAVIT